MHLSSKELERVWMFALAEMARKRLGKGLKLNYPEALGLICDEVMEAAREGYSLEDAVERGCSVLTTNDVMEGVAALARIIQVEAAFTDGTRLVTLHNPIRDVRVGTEGAGEFPGQVVPGDEPIPLFSGRSRQALLVRNTSDRPIWIGSHFPLEKANLALEFDRARAKGWRLNVPAGQVTLFPPGEETTVEIIPAGGNGAPSSTGDGEDAGVAR